MLSTIPALIPTDNPRLVELARLVAARIDRGYDYLTACKLVSAKVDMSLSLVSEAYDYVVGIGDYPSVPSAEDLGGYAPYLRRFFFPGRSLRYDC
jgi:hypothetical protein